MNAEPIAYGRKAQVSSNVRLHSQNLPHEEVTPHEAVSYKRSIGHSDDVIGKGNFVSRVSRHFDRRHIGCGDRIGNGTG